MSDYYKTLGVPVSSSQDDIKKSFRTLALQYHPDRHLNSGKEQQAEAEARFKAVNEAYATLGDERQRKRYDMQQVDWHSRSSTSSRSHAHVNRDWSRSYYQHHATEGTYTSRAGWWELAARLYRHRMRNTEAAAQGTFLLLLAGGLLFAAGGSNALWELNNRGKQFKDIEAGKRQEE